MGLASNLPKLKEFAALPPKRVRGGPVQEVIWRGDEVDLTKLPVLKCWPGDGGPFVTLPLVVSKDPETGDKNIGMYRMQVFDKNTTGMHWQRHKTGARHLEKSETVRTAARGRRRAGWRPGPHLRGDRAHPADSGHQRVFADGVFARQIYRTYQGM